MKVGTRSLLFGYHQFALHPLLVAWSWWRLYGFPWDPRLWVCFLVHDWGYWGKPNMDGPEGEEHPRLGANIAWRLCGAEYGSLCIRHSRFYARRLEVAPSALCWADKRVIAVTPSWLQLGLMWLGGELAEYRGNDGSTGRTPGVGKSAFEWCDEMRAVCREAVEKATTYKCAQCEGVFKRQFGPNWNDDKARAEHVERFGAPPDEDAAVVCDSCYNKIMLWLGETN